MFSLRNMIGGLTLGVSIARIEAKRKGQKGGESGRSSI
jgi:hypothetical protein